MPKITASSQRRSARLARLRQAPYHRQRIYGKVGAAFDDVDHGGLVRLGSNWTLTGYWPRSSNNGVGLTRKYPVTSRAYRQAKSDALLKMRTQQTMFSSLPASDIGYVRGHRIPHADTARTSPASGGLLSTLDKDNYYPEPEGWGEQQRKRREGKARSRGTPVFQYEVFDPSDKPTHGGTPVPRGVYFIEATSLSQDNAYASSKSYNAKAYHVDYATFDYDALPKAGNSDRRRLKPLRVTKLSDLPTQLQHEIAAQVTLTGGIRL